MRNIAKHASCLLTLVAMTSAPSRSEAQQFVAECSGLSGLRVDDKGDGRAQADEDGVRNATWRYMWDMAKKEATLVLRNSAAAGGAQNTETAVAIRMADYVVFVSVLPGAVWAHAIYPKSGLVSVTQHTDGNGSLSGRLSSKLLTGQCRVTMN